MPLTNNLVLFLVKRINIFPYFHEDFVSHVITTLPPRKNHSQFPSDQNSFKSLVLRIASTAPSNKATCLGYRHNRVLVTAGVE